MSDVWVDSVARLSLVAEYGVNFSWVHMDMRSATHLLMPRVFRTDDVYSAFPPHHRAPIAYPLHRRPNLHPSCECLRCLHHGWCRGMNVGVHMGHCGKPHTGEQGPARGEEGAQHGGGCVSCRARQASRPGPGSRSRADFCSGNHVALSDTLGRAMAVLSVGGMAGCNTPQPPGCASCFPLDSTLDSRTHLAGPDTPLSPTLTLIARPEPMSLLVQAISATLHHDDSLQQKHG